MKEKEKKYFAEVIDIKSSTGMDDEGFKLEKLEVTKEEIFKDSGMTAFSKKGNGSEPNNQDDYCIYADPYIRIFAVFDGHGSNRK